MTSHYRSKNISQYVIAMRRAALALFFAVITSFNIFSHTLTLPTDTVPIQEFPDSIYLSFDRNDRVLVEGDSIIATGDSLEMIPVGAIPVDTVKIDPITGKAMDPDYRVREFNPDPTRALWMSALCPGLGQLYNRRYWKLPIVVGAYVGLGYATSWNNRMLNDYTQAYRDLTDDDPSTKSYMNFYPPGTDESRLNYGWLEKAFKSKKDYFRRNRDLCIICMIGAYFVAMLDAYVDASLAHFDISDNLSVDVQPSVIRTSPNNAPGVGVNWAFNF